MQQGPFAEIVTALQTNLLAIDLDFERALCDQKELVAHLTFAHHFDAARNVVRLHRPGNFQQPRLG